MKRKEFLKTGVCTCLLSLTGSIPLRSEEEKQSGNTTVNMWTDHLMKVLDQNLDQKTKTMIMYECGKGCARRTFGSQIKKFTGKTEELLGIFKKSWAEIAEYDQQKGIIALAGKPGSPCGCYMIKGKKTIESKTLCLCSVGWMIETFGTVTGKKVQVELVETVLTGENDASLGCIYPDY